ncbi:HAMP domain-containing sensor histidine kinase [Dactylosporangium sp. NPDC000244]|uniref:sensor histidine kinase n=1 Tax=Dactylosporangium sp. NPDC000244 TaxID=3154365 RepID=UPI0033173E89
MNWLMNWLTNWRMNWRWTVRRQLTFLYAGPFLVSGLVLLLIPLLGTRVSSPVGDGQAPLGGIESEQTPAFIKLVVFSMFSMLVIAVVLGWQVSGLFLRPLRIMIDTARDISATNLHRRLGEMGRSDEFAELAETLDDLFARLEASFAAQRRFVANASHELRTPLTAQRALLQVTLADPEASPADLRAAAREVLTLGESQARLIDSLLTLATGEQGVEDALPLDLAEVARRVLADRPLEGLTLTTSLDAAPAKGAADLVESLVANLVDNAAKHNVPGGTVTVTTGVTGRRATLSVQNTGPVVPEDELDRLFQPFQRLGAQRVRTTKDGYGLGLAIVRAIANAHHADLTATAPPGGGLQVTVTFP